MSGPSFADALLHAASERPDLVVLVGADPGPAGQLAQTWPERVLAVGPQATRLGAAEGFVRAGSPAVAVLDRTTDAIPPAAGVVLLATARDQLVLARRAGLDIAQPGWDADVPALLAALLDRQTAAVLHLPDLEGAPGPGLAPEPPSAPLDRPRVLRRGPAGVVIGAGRTARAASWVGTSLAGRQIHLTVLDLVLVTAASEVDAALLADHLLVGPADSPRPAAMAAVPVGEDLAATAERVRAALGA